MVSVAAVELSDGVAPISKIGLGTWQFGSREWGYGEEYASRGAVEIVRRALELGVTLFDTAEAYAGGRSERILGGAIGADRARAFIATKLFPVFPSAPITRRRGRASARRLGVSRIDLYQLHWPNPLVTMDETMRGMKELRDAGVVAEVGVSNYGLERWKAAEESLGGRVLSDQVRYSLLSRGPEEDLIPWAEANGRVVIAYSPLAQGVLTGKYDASNTRTNLLGAANPLFSRENLRRVGPLIDTLREVAAAHGATPSQVALAWTIRSPAVVAIPGASSVAQLESNVAAANLELARDEVEALSAASDAFRPAPLDVARPVRAAASALKNAVGLRA